MGDAYKFLAGEKGRFIVPKSDDEFQIVITAESIKSTDDEFSEFGYSSESQYRLSDVFFQKANGAKEHRNHAFDEGKMNYRTLPRLVFQIFEDQIMSLSESERREFPTGRSPREEATIFSGIASDLTQFKVWGMKGPYTPYKITTNDGWFYIQYDGIFSTLLFAKECLIRFGEPGDKFILSYSKTRSNVRDQSSTQSIASEQVPLKETIHYRNTISNQLIKSKNIIFRGAPGTGKSYLAKAVATDIVSNGTVRNYIDLSKEQKQQIEFVQFHPSYDYADFVEGLRPTINDDGSMGFQLQPGIFSQFISRAKKNLSESMTPRTEAAADAAVNFGIDTFLEDFEFGQDMLETTHGTKFTITKFDDKSISISIPTNKISDKVILSTPALKELLATNRDYKKTKDINVFFGIQNAAQKHSYYYALYQKIHKIIKSNPLLLHTTKVEYKQFVFIIDEINRGEISKIFGELFFAIDPDYRGRIGEVSTQFSNLHENPNDKFYIPENVFIIGTMNDIDRSVDSFDFAMRRRFRFIEIKADENTQVLNSLEESKRAEAQARMHALNEKISAVDELNENYQIGAAYFSKLSSMSFTSLWTDYLEPLLQDYVRGMPNEVELLDDFKKAYENASHN